MIRAIKHLLRGHSSRRRQPFCNSPEYWEQRYGRGNTSGPGSYGRIAEFKAQTLNQFVTDEDIQSVIEFGCGDGNQLALANYPIYIGLDVAPTAVRMCADRFKNDPTKSFLLYDTRAFVDRHGLLRAELALSLEVVFHLVEDDIYEQYMHHLFDAATRCVVLYTSNVEQSSPSPHIKHHAVVSWVEAHRPDWCLREKIDTPWHADPDLPGNQPGHSFSDFFIFERAQGAQQG